MMNQLVEFLTMAKTFGAFVNGKKCTWVLVNGRKLMIGGKFWGATSRIDGVVIDGKTYGSTIVESNFWACWTNRW
jgi:hypothetical protein